MAPCEIHLRMPSRVLFFTPAIKAVSSTMQLKILRLGGSGARMAAVLAAARAVCGCGLPRMVVVVVRCVGRSECRRGVAMAMRRV